MIELSKLALYRARAWEASLRFGEADGQHGAFVLPSPVDGLLLAVIATAGAGWDHVSVSRRDRIPTWEEMAHVKALFFERDEVAMELHVPAADHVDFHPRCLHLWRPNDGREIPRPQAEMVGPTCAAGSRS